MNNKLFLEDGTEFYGSGFGSMENACGEVVFVTSMTGYQELLTDPSFYGQIVVMSYPMIGNYGINRDDYEALQPALAGLIVKEYAEKPCNFRMNKNIKDYLEKMKVPALSDVDTRKLTVHLRNHGSMRGAILPAEMTKAEALKYIEEYQNTENPLIYTSTKHIYQIPANGKRIVLVDFGAKTSLIRDLSEMNYHLIVVPYNTKAYEVMEFNPDAVILAGGSGNPNDMSEQIESVKELLGEVPMLGIAMGHYLLAKACGADLKKLKFGHHGNAPIKVLETGKIWMVGQNHSYTVHQGTLSGTGLKITHTSMNDGSVMGLRHTKYPALSVQFQPEGSPGGKDGMQIFEELQKMIAH